MSRLRDLEFREPVRLEVIDAERARRLLGPPETPESSSDLRAREEAYRALGALPPGVDLAQALASLRARELVGVYVSREKTLFVRQEFATTDGEGSLIVLHEMVHALQDQHFPRTFALLGELRHQEDLVTAITSVLEGDATLATLYGHESGGGRELPIAEHERDLMLAELRRSAAGSSVPLLLRASLVFPYAHGTVHAARTFAAEGNAGLDRSLEDPPLSSRDVLAGSREPVEFVELPLEQIGRDVRAHGCEPGHHDVAGALRIGVLFEAHGAELPAPLPLEWRGDRFLHLRCPGAPELFWVVRFAAPSAAADFARHYQGISEEVARWAGHAGAPRVRAHGRDVAIVTPLADLFARPWLARTRFHAHGHLADWLANGCPGEPACPPQR